MGTAGRRGAAHHQPPQLFWEANPPKRRGLPAIAGFVANRCPKDPPDGSTAPWGLPKDHPRRSDLSLGPPQRPARPLGPLFGAPPKTTRAARTSRWGLP